MIAGGDHRGDENGGSEFAHQPSSAERLVDEQSAPVPGVGADLYPQQERGGYERDAAAQHADPQQPATQWQAISLVTATTSGEHRVQDGHRGRAEQRGETHQADPPQHRLADARAVGARYLPGGAHLALHAEDDRPGRRVQVVGRQCAPDDVVGVGGQGRQGGHHLDRRLRAGLRHATRGGAPRVRRTR
jgi:hypothetical protein